MAGTSQAEGFLIWDPLTNLRRDFHILSFSLLSQIFARDERPGSKEILFVHMLLLLVLDNLYRLTFASKDPQQIASSS